MKKSIVIILFLLLSLIAIASLGVAIYSYRQVQSVKKIATAVSPDDDQNMIAAIGSFMMLPDEKPTIVSVTDRDKLQDQEFFKKALNGDKVVIYEGIRRIFLYRPSLKKIIDIAPLVYNQPKTATVSASPVVSPTKQATSSSSVVGQEEQGNFKL